MRRAAWALAFVLTMAQAASGGAWTLDRHHTSVIAGSILSSASRRYDGGGADGKPIVFEKYLFQTWMEYGLTDAVTVFAAPEYVIARTDLDGAGLARVHSRSIEAGVRILMLSKIGMLSVQGSAKTGGAFDMSVSSSGESGRQFEVRLLYGRGFKLFRRDGFVDVALAERWLDRPRPDEYAADASLGWWVTKNNLLLAQSFNFMTAGAVRRPYQSYELSKVQLSLVHRFAPRWSIQSGWFRSIAGRNIVQESGWTTAIWFQT